MKRLKDQFPKIFSTVLVAGLTVFSLSAFGQNKSKNMTVKGEVLDMACYMAKGAHGPGHAQCAKMCLSQGAPAGLLTASGKVYLLVGDHGNATPYKNARKDGAKQVTVTGKYQNRNGVQALVVEDVKKDS